MLEEIDVVVPVALKDISKLSSCVEGVFKNSLNPIRKLYIVTSQCANPAFTHPSIFWVDELEYPFEKECLAVLFEAKGSPYENSSWYYQQLLKS